MSDASQTESSVPFRRMMPVTVEVLGDREVRVRMSTSGRARDGHILEPDGCILDNYRTNPIVLWSHDPLLPIGNNDEVVVDAGGISARTIFAPPSISVTADEICGLVKSGVIRAVSIGFAILEGTPIDPSRPKGGLRATKWELLECSFVSVPADTGAVVTERTITLTPNKEMAAMADEPNPRLVTARTRMQLQTTGLKRGLYDVAQLAYVLSQLGYLKANADWEAEYEGDASPVPALLGECLVKIGTALVEMTKEEVAELLESTGTAVLLDEAVLDSEERAYLRSAPSSRLRMVRSALVTITRAGKTISAATAEKLNDTAANHAEALGHTKVASGLYDKAADKHEEAGALAAKLQSAHDKMGTAIEACRAAPGADTLEAVAKQHGVMGKHLDTLDAAHTDVGTALDGADDAVKAATRSVRVAQRCVRSILATAADDEDTTDVQTSEGTAASDGAANGRSYSKERRLRSLALFEKSIGLSA